MVFITIVTGAYKQTYNWGGHIVGILQNFHLPDQPRHYAVNMFWLTNSNDWLPKGLFLGIIKENSFGIPYLALPFLPYIRIQSMVVNIFQVT